MAKQKMTQKQREARIKAAEERETRQKAAQARAARTKQIFTIIVCVVLVLALGLPTVGLTLCSNQNVQQAAVETSQAVGDAGVDAGNGGDA